MLRICDIARLCGCFLVNLIVNAIVDSDICVWLWPGFLENGQGGSAPKIRHLRFFFPKMYNIVILYQSGDSPRSFTWRLDVVPPKVDSAAATGLVGVAVADESWSTKVSNGLSADSGRWQIARSLPVVSYLLVGRQQFLKT